MIATYGHGTENDFVLVFDPENEVSITTAQTAAICNRQTGIVRPSRPQTLSSAPGVENLPHDSLSKLRTR